MKGFLLGAMTLVVIEVLGRSTEPAAGLLGTIANGVKRALAPNVAGIRNFTNASRDEATRAPEPTTTVPGRPPRTGRQVSRPGHPVAQ